MTNLENLEEIYKRPLISYNNNSYRIDREIQELKEKELDLKIELDILINEKKDFQEDFDQEFKNLQEKYSLKEKNNESQQRNIKRELKRIARIVKQNSELISKYSGNFQ